MLTKRTNILFDEKTWGMLVKLAGEKETSVGELVRKAVTDIYINNHVQKEKDMRIAMNELSEIHKSIPHTFTFEEIKESIEYGRKY